MLPIKEGDIVRLTAYEDWPNENDWDLVKIIEIMDDEVIGRVVFVQNMVGQGKGACWGTVPLQNHCFVNVAVRK